ncbi:DNA polymerase III chi subunit [Sinobacterium caligoides]|uniref:DNA polymerase III chi subunit n=1 Tax=Sinobacterium caligoides TaxID=933926 RepID=A0A3N2DZG1_9GAMM|nr:DNA polymerase III subunit chi [Sinobacterium caligoides]ROS05253.1 DNA polymerase III chi subunit [Sinobacterium caligoides]
MPKALFYLMASTDDLQRLKYACTLAEKSYRKDKSVFIHTSTEAESREIDKLLWTVRDNSFIPHQLDPATAAEANSPIIISHREIKGCNCQVLINLSTPLNSHDNIEWILEVVHQRDDIKQLSRSNWRHYQQQGIALSSKHC